MGTHRRQRQVVHGKTVRWRTELHLGDDGRTRVGWLHVSPGRAVWRSMFGRTRVDLSGARVRAVSGTVVDDETVGDTDLRLTLPDGGRVRLGLKRADAVTLLAALAAWAPAAEPAPPAWRRWPVVVLVACGTWLRSGHSTARSSIRTGPSSAL
ncbi:hypothetical protein [Cryptosporangium sp. NPDC048952]|uniref:hypothetical protein n=1 Tax=Cryptosporangium sp. NPDC048952 TaxID=3363961 RepID=UPI0037224B4D